MVGTRRRSVITSPAESRTPSTPGASAVTRKRNEPAVDKNTPVRKSRRMSEIVADNDDMVSSAKVSGGRRTGESPTDPASLKLIVKVRGEDSLTRVRSPRTSNSSATPSTLTTPRSKTQANADKKGEDKKPEKKELAELVSEDSRTPRARTPRKSAQAKDEGKVENKAVRELISREVFAKKSSPMSPSRVKRVIEADTGPATPTRVKIVSESESRPATPTRKSRRLSGNAAELAVDSPILPLKKRRTSISAAEPIKEETAIDSTGEGSEKEKDCTQATDEKPPANLEAIDKAEEIITEGSSHLNTIVEDEDESVADAMEDSAEKAVIQSEIVEPKADDNGKMAEEAVEEDKVAEENKKEVNVSEDLKGKVKVSEDLVGKDTITKETNQKAKITEKRTHEDLTNKGTKQENFEQNQQELKKKEIKVSNDENSKKNAKPKTSAEMKMLEDLQNLILLNKIPRQKPKSGKFWKSERSQFRAIKKDKGQRRTFEERYRIKEEKQRTKELADSLLQGKTAKQQELRKRIEENKKRKEERQLKNEVFQVVKNPNKIKRMKKRDLAKRDILGKI